MNKSIFIFLLTSIIVLNALNAQQHINLTMDHNARFDQIIKQDEEIKIISSDSIPKTKTPIPKSALEYNSKKEYSAYFLLYDFCKRDYKEKDVLQFIEDAFADTTRDDFFAKDLHKLPCSSVKNYTSVKNIFIDYYKKNIKLNPNDKTWRRRFFDFQVVNNFPNTLDLINNYFENINSYERKLRDGQNLIIRLVEIKEEQKALELFEFYVQQFWEGNIPHNLNLEESMTNKNGGLLLALSENEEISKAATNLLFKYYEVAAGSRLEQEQYLEYIDKNRFIEIERKRFYNSKDSDLSNEMNLNRYIRYISKMLQLSGKEMGKEIWGYIKKDERLLHGQYFKQSLHYFLEKILEDSKLNGNDKSEIINYFREHIKYINDKESETDHRTFIQYLYLVRTSYPEITDKEIEQYIPKKYLDDFTWEYAWRDAKNYQLLYGAIPSNLSAVKRCHSDLEQTFIFGDEFPKRLNKFQTFTIHSQGGLNIQNYLRYIFNNSEKVIGFDTEGGYAPLDYEMLFEREFSPLLQDKGIYGIRVIQEAVTSDNRNFNYKIQIVTEKGTEKFQYSSGSDWYEPVLFVKALNLSLIKLDTPLRFFQIETGDQGSSFGLFEPNKIVPFAKKYNMQIGALRSQDIFNDL